MLLGSFCTGVWQGFREIWTSELLIRGEWGGTDGQNQKRKFGSGAARETKYGITKDLYFHPLRYKLALFALFLSVFWSDFHFSEDDSRILFMSLLFLSLPLLGMMK